MNTSLSIANSCVCDSVCASTDADIHSPSEPLLKDDKVGTDNIPDPDDKVGTDSIPDPDDKVETDGVPNPDVLLSASVDVTDNFDSTKQRRNSDIVSADLSLDSNPVSDSLQTKMAARDDGCPIADDIIQAAQCQTLPDSDSSFSKSSQSSDKPTDRQHSLFLSQLDMSEKDIRICQADDPCYKPIIDYLSSGLLPKSQRKCRDVLLQHSDYVLLNGILFHCQLAKPKRTKLQSQYQLVLPKVLVPVILQLYHNSPLGGHGGIQDTLDRIREHYYFERLATIVGDYVRSCHECQMRKVTRVHGKSDISAYPTPSEPFSVWEVDLYGPLPCSERGNTYLFTAVDMFSKYLFAKPIANKDAATVSVVIMDLFTQYGTCDTLISDQGSEFTASVTSILCKMLDVPQQFSPSFVHHCMGACERTHRTLATKLTPYLNKRCNDWDAMVSLIVFSMNNAVNSTTGYSPFEILYAQRPKFPLSPCVPDLKSLPKDYATFMQQKQAQLTVIRDSVKKNIVDAQTNMTTRANAKAKPIHLSEGDYVYVTDESTGPAKKLKNCYKGPFVVQCVNSPHMVTLIDPTTKVQLPQLIHVDRLKPAYIRQPVPSSYFKVVTKIQRPDSKETSTQTVSHVTAQGETESRTQSNADHKIDPVVTVPIAMVEHDVKRVRPKRTIRKPHRFCDSDLINPDDVKDVSSSDVGDFHKIKRVLAQRPTADGIQYLVHFAGEPAQNAMWLPGSDLNIKAKEAIKSRPPPIV